MENENKEISLQLEATGLQCDNPKCDWVDASIKMDDYKDWLNKPCPKCGQNVLTEEDHVNAQILVAVTKMAQSLPLKDLVALGKSLGVEDIKNNPMFKGAKGLEHLDNSELVSMTITTHGEIKVEEIQKIK